MWRFTSAPEGWGICRRAENVMFFWCLFCMLFLVRFWKRVSLFFLCFSVSWGSIAGLNFEYFSSFWGMFLSIVFYWVPGLIFQWFWCYFDILLTYFRNCSHLWFSWFLTTLPIENSFFTGLTASLLTHFVLVFSTSFQVSFLTWFSQLLKLFWCPFCAKKQEKTARGKAWFFGCEKRAAETVFIIFERFWGTFLVAFCSTLGCPFS